MSIGCWRAKVKSYLEVRDGDLFHEGVDDQPAPRAPAREHEDLLVSHRARLVNGRQTRRRGRRRNRRSVGSKADGLVLLGGAVVLAHVPLRVRHRAVELEERVARRVIQLDRELGCEQNVVLHVRVRVLGHDGEEEVDDALDFGVCGLVNVLAHGLVHAEVLDGVAQDALDCGELPAAGGDGELELRDDDGAGGRLDDLTVQVALPHDVAFVMDTLV